MKPVIGTIPVAYETLAASADLTKLAAIGGGQIYLSTNSGAAWNIASAPGANWVSIASSADGTRLAALAIQGPQEGYTGQVYLSTASGATWNAVFGAGAELFFEGVFISANGQTLVVTAQASAISTNAGLNWSIIPGGFSSLGAGPYDSLTAASSADGTLTAVTSFGFGTTDAGIYISPNSGAKWFRANAPVTDSILVSADGTKVATLYGGTLYTSNPNPSHARKFVPIPASGR